MPASTLMVRRLDGPLAPPPGWSCPRVAAGVRLADLTADVETLSRLEVDCRPPGHIDRDQVIAVVADGSFRRLLAGDLLGPVLAAPSGQLEVGDGELVGACIVVRWQGWPPWPGGPWIADIHITPARQGQGLGTALLQRAIAASAALGEVRIGLNVTNGNRARVLYERFGFVPL
jgi:GNAT superfamily N-acetyltransferase